MCSHGPVSPPMHKLRCSSQHARTPRPSLEPNAATPMSTGRWSGLQAGDTAAVCGCKAALTAIQVRIRWWFWASSPVSRSPAALLFGMLSAEHEEMCIFVPLNSLFPRLSLLRGRQSHRLHLFKRHRITKSKNRNTRKLRFPTCLHEASSMRRALSSTKRKRSDPDRRRAIGTNCDKTLNSLEMQNS